nr:TetR/AcrR family transcriptional regulator [Marinicella sp. W31]MDC2880065.1 TetR/AcrR family transcriptional regulator [Marinicella sp. W31]
MGRKPTISRDGLLTIAEDIVNTEGPQALTIDALAKAAGISKGGVQYSFSSKDELVKGLVDRWTTQFDSLSPTSRVWGRSPLC